MQGVACQVSVASARSLVGGDHQYLQFGRNRHEDILGIDVKVYVRNKSFRAEFVYEEETIDIELCKVREESAFYIDEIARRCAEDYIRNRRIAERRT